MLTYESKFYLGRVQVRARHANLLRIKSIIYHFPGFVKRFGVAISLQTSFLNYTELIKLLNFYDIPFFRKKMIDLIKSLK